MASTAAITPEADLQRTISILVRMLMARDGLNQTALGGRVGMDQTTVSAKLRGVNRWTVEDIRRLADAFAVHPGVFYSNPKSFTPSLTVVGPDRESTGWLIPSLLAPQRLAA